MRLGFIAFVTEELGGVDVLLDHRIDNQAIVHDPRLLAVGEEGVLEVAAGRHHIGVAARLLFNYSSRFRVLVEVREQRLDFGRIIGAEVFLGQAAAIEQRAGGCLIGIGLGDAIVGSDIGHEGIGLVGLRIGQQTAEILQEI